MNKDDVLIRLKSKIRADIEKAVQHEKHCLGMLCISFVTFITLFFIYFSNWDRAYFLLIGSLLSSMIAYLIFLNVHRTVLNGVWVIGLIKEQERIEKDIERRNSNNSTGIN